MREKFQKFLEKIFPSGSIRREYYDRIRASLDILRYGGISEFLWGLKIFILIKLNVNSLINIPKINYKTKGDFSVIHPILLDPYYNKILRKIDRKIKLELNHSALISSGLRASSHLLKLVTLVDTGVGNND